MSNTIGKLFKISVFGESHGKCIGVVIDCGIAGLKISEDDMTRFYQFVFLWQWLFNFYY